MYALWLLPLVPRPLSAAKLVDANGVQILHPVTYNTGWMTKHFPTIMVATVLLLATVISFTVYWCVQKQRSESKGKGRSKSVSDSGSGTTATTGSSKTKVPIKVKKHFKKHRHLKA